MRKLAFAAPILAAFVGCAPIAIQSPSRTTITGKGQVSLAVLGSDLTNAAFLANIAADVLGVSDSSTDPFAAEIHTAAASVQATGISLEASGAVTGDTSATVAALKAALNAAATANISPASAAKVQVALDAVGIALTLVQSALPVAAVPAAS